MYFVLIVKQTSGSWLPCLSALGFHGHSLCTFFWSPTWPKLKTQISWFIIYISVTWSLIQTNPVVSKSFKKNICESHRYTGLSHSLSAVPSLCTVHWFLSVYGMQTLKTILKEDQGKEKGFFFVLSSHLCHPFIYSRGTLLRLLTP